jgi:hypothetical protein
MYNKLVGIAWLKKDIVNIAESSFWINFDHTMMEIYSDSFVSGVIPIAFE